MSKNRNDSKFPIKRLSGGPRLPLPQHQWFLEEIERIKTVDKVKNFSMVDLLCRIADADLDLSTFGLARYRRPTHLKQKYKPLTRTA